MERTLKNFSTCKAISSWKLGHINTCAFYNFPLLHILCKGLNFKSQTREKKDFHWDGNINVFTWFQIAELLSSCVHWHFFTNEAVLELRSLRRRIFDCHKAPCFAKWLISAVEDLEFVCLLTSNILKEAPARGGEMLGGNSHNQTAATGLVIGSGIEITGFRIN